jgi:hypothetical protein
MPSSGRLTTLSAMILQILQEAGASGLSTEEIAAELERRSLDDGVGHVALADHANKPLPRHRTGRSRAQARPRTPRLPN